MSDIYLKYYYKAQNRLLAMTPYKTLIVVIIIFQDVFPFAPKIVSFRPSTAPLFAKRKKKKPSFSLDTFFKPNVIQKKNSSPMESGIETALLLLDKKRQSEWKDDVKKEFPFIPSGVLDICLDSVADGFSSIAPSQLKQALQPGGLEKMRPEIEKSIVQQLLEDNQIAKTIPLPRSDKKQILLNLVHMSLDFVFQDALVFLSEPNIKLLALEEQRYQIRRYMTKRQRIWYEIRYHPIQTSAGILFAVLLYREIRATAFAKAISSFVLSTWHLFVTGISFIQNAISKILPTSSTKIVKGINRRGSKYC